jgi:putative addiction module killer protein
MVHANPVTWAIELLYSLGYNNSCPKFDRHWHSDAGLQGCAMTGPEPAFQARIDRLSLGNPGDVRPLSSGLSELRIDYGPGYRVYFVQRGAALVILLARGDKRTQQNDIERALDLLRRL